jgi:hypothetical protein
MPRDRFSASIIGTFACRSFPRDTKASKRANKHKGVQKFDTQEIRLGSNEKETTYLLDTRVVIQEKIVILENILIVEH